jgi:hypothetical protein
MVGGCVDKLSTNHCPSKISNQDSKFRVIRIWPINVKAMDDKS